jgi:hypothetical protein
MAIISESREVSEFDRILVKGFGKFFIKQGGEQSVTVKADEEIIKRITTEVEDRKLVIDIGRDWVERISMGINLLSSREIVVEITVKELLSLDIAGACDLEASGIRGDALELKMSGASTVKVLDVDTNKIMTDMPGAGKILVNGKTGEQQITMTGAGAYDASHLESQNARVTLTGVGNATVWAKENLEVAVTGVGSIEYYGNPHIKQSTTMLGSVRNLGESPK